MRLPTIHASLPAAAWLLLLTTTTTTTTPITSHATPIVVPERLQAPLEDLADALDALDAGRYHEQASGASDAGRYHEQAFGASDASPPPRQLHGRFLHITDLHPDPHYKIHSSTEEDAACHRGKGLAGTYGAETSDCDTPFGLVNATLEWIEEHVRDTIDFVVWTGDSARHDSDEHIPRTQAEVLNTNRWVVSKMTDVFSKAGPDQDLAIPIVSTFGNNDILPHNILLSGPNKWLKTYTDIWSDFIPEEQRHGFERGGWYYVEVIPNTLAVFSLNTLYFFDHNAAVDGCALRSEPGYEHFEWLRIQLQFMRERGMKVILIGHVPPARTDSKQLWDETCWQKYTLWLQRYRDIIVGGLYGHMNIDHFMLQDTKQIDLVVAGGDDAHEERVRTYMGDELTIESANDYLEELRETWSDLPNPTPAMTQDGLAEDEELLGGETTSARKNRKGKKPKKSKKDRALRKIGGPWGERFQVTLVGPSIVPNFFPTLRVIEYNITGLDRTLTWANAKSSIADEVAVLEEITPTKEIGMREETDDEEDFDHDEEFIDREKKKKKGKKGKKPKNPDLIVPFPPSKSSPPGPAYSPQMLTMTGYTQYFANLTHINNDNYANADVDEADVDAEKWKAGKHKGKHPKNEPHPKKFRFQVEYDTFTDPIYKLQDLTVRSYIKLAHRIGQYKPKKGDSIDELEDLPEHHESDNQISIDGKKDKKRKKKKKKHRKEKNKVWIHFIENAFVRTLQDADIDAMGSLPETNSGDEIEAPQEAHDGEL